MWFCEVWGATSINSELFSCFCSAGHWIITKWQAFWRKSHWLSWCNGCFLLQVTGQSCCNVPVRFQWPEKARSFGKGKIAIGTHFLMKSMNEGTKKLHEQGNQSIRQSEPSLSYIRTQSQRHNRRILISWINKILILIYASPLRVQS